MLVSKKQLVGNAVSCRFVNLDGKDFEVVTNAQIEEKNQTTTPLYGWLSWEREDEKDDG